MDQLLNKKTASVPLLALLLLMACKGATGKQAATATIEKIAPVQELNENTIPIIISDKPQVAAGKSYTTCEALITDLLKSSNAPGIKRFREAQVRIVDKNTEKISVELYVSYKITEGPFKNRQTEFTIGWFDFYPATGILQDITNDPERPQKLQYNTTILQTADWDSLCLVPLKKTGRQ